jgi:DNA excision repair protein ERCC-4
MKELLNYQKQILTQLSSEDNLVVLAPGLGLSQVLMPLIQLYNNEKHLVLLLNSEASSLPVQMIGNCPLKSINTGSTPAQRQELYKQGGVLIVTGTILSTDMLSNKIPIDKITGLIILKSHLLKPNCKEEFAIRMYREKNQAS